MLEFTLNDMMLGSEFVILIEGERAVSVSPDRLELYLCTKSFGPDAGVFTGCFTEGDYYMISPDTGPGFNSFYTVYVSGSKSGFLLTKEELDAAFTKVPSRSKEPSGSFDSR